MKKKKKKKKKKKRETIKKTCEKNKGKKHFPS